MIKKLLENKAEEGGKYERILGGLTNLNDIAAFWEKHPDKIQLIAINGLLEYTENESFSKEEYDAFVKGLSVVGNAMQGCWEERQDVIREGLPQVSEEDSEADGSF